MDDISERNVMNIIEELQIKEQKRIKEIQSEIQKGCDKCSQWDEYFGCCKCQPLIPHPSKC
jgi:hypothetical protein